MTVIDEKTLDLFRGPGQCEYCGRFCKVLEPHHVSPRGTGKRLDIKINLIALGSAFDCACHLKFHDGNILTIDLEAIVATRENRTQDDILKEIWEYRARIKPNEAVETPGRRNGHRRAKKRWPTKAAKAEWLKRNVPGSL